MNAIVLVSQPESCQRFGGITLWQRTVRGLAVEGADTVRLVVAEELVDSELKQLAEREPVLGEDGLRIVDSDSLCCEDLLSATEGWTGLCLLARADRIFDRRILRAGLETARPTVVVDSHPSDQWIVAVESTPQIPQGNLCGLAVVDSTWVRTNHGVVFDRLVDEIPRGAVSVVDVETLPLEAANLRRELRPFWLAAPNADTSPVSKRALLASTQKGSLDLPALAHAPIEKAIVWRIADTPITPNLVTGMTTVVALVATGLFARGWLIAGLVLALSVGILDGVDGKLARIRLEFSKFGRFEHLLDFLYEWSWWIALAYYLSSSGRLPEAWTALLLLALFEAIDAIAKGISLLRFGKLIDELGSFERVVRLIGGRRNVYIWILTLGALMGRIEQAYLILPIWQGLTALLHWIRLPWLLLRCKGIASAQEVEG